MRPGLALALLLALPFAAGAAGAHHAACAGGVGFGQSYAGVVAFVPGAGSECAGATAGSRVACGVVRAQVGPPPAQHLEQGVRDPTLGASDVTVVVLEGDWCDVGAVARP